MNLQQFLTQRIGEKTLGTDDVLASFLPLVREVIKTHRAGLVAPLEGLAELHVQDGRIWFEEAKRQPLRRNPSEMKRLEEAGRMSVEVLAENRRTVDLGTGEEVVASADVAVRGSFLQRPVYLPGHVSWEHELEHHDPLTDIFSLGMLLASLACGIDLNEPGELERFVVHRRNLFVLNANLHPTLAQAILRMTELDRHRRGQDLPAILASLENYRDQSVDFSIDLARLPGLHSRDVKTKTSTVLARLRDRLFDISRRNTLLSFRPTLNNLNLTQASLPLLLDIRKIGDDRVLTWSDSLRQQLAACQPVSLNKYLNFAEAVYLPSLLERIIADARRDQQEFGIAQLRLVVCFLTWSNLKVKPAESWNSPLVLLPVKLTKTKGIRDTFQVEALSSEAEVNPVLRHQFRQLYNIELPESVDLATTGLDSLFEYLQGKIQANEPAVSITKVERPRIDLLHEKAQRRLDQYRRSARVSGRGVRSFQQIDYSYDAANFHPLGIKLFAAKIRTPGSRLRDIIEDRPRPRSFASADGTNEVSERERTLFHVRDATEANPYLWNFDLCSLTLANFHYRRMSLVRDYESLVEFQPANQAFDATFSLAPRPVGRELPVATPLEDRFDVVPCDPTQSTAIAEARHGGSYIIQGPPGTGKSQTITNLIADFAARGKRVLFVCEKRAAIDVVFARLRQTGLGSLCCLIHDSQTDKKEFVFDLKQTYEALLDESKPAAKKKSPRAEALRAMHDSLAPLEQFDNVMSAEHALAGLPPRMLLERCLRLRAVLPDVSPEHAERLPPYADWENSRAALANLQPILEELEPSGILARHPLRLLSPRLSDVERPMETVGRATQAALGLLDRAIGLFLQSGISREQWDRFDRMEMLVDYGNRVAPFATNENLALLAATSFRSRDLDRAMKQIRNAEQALEAARTQTTSWREKLSVADVRAALGQASQFEGQKFPWLSLGWWRLRSLLNRAYDFRSHQIRPSWTAILTALKVEHEAAAALQAVHAQTRQRFEFRDDLTDTLENVRAARAWLRTLPDWLASIHQSILADESGEALVRKVCAATTVIVELRGHLERAFVDFKGLPVDDLRASLVETSQSLRQVPQALEVLGELKRISPEIGKALRESPWTMGQMEAALAHTTWQKLCQAERATARFHGDSQRKQVAKLETHYDRWLDANSEEICRRVQKRFLDHVRISNLTASQLTPDQKEYKKNYVQGRRTLEHEFGKTMRFRSIRELVDGDSGLVVRDLKPVWLMSPLSVSDTLPLTSDFFDVVIFDEASQVPLEEAVPSLFRGQQVIVVGDEMQLPPTEFFTIKHPEDEQEVSFDVGEQRVRFDLTSNSLLNHAAKNLPATMLGWHYRSRSESLISFSNWAFYDGRLLTVPDQQGLTSVGIEVAEALRQPEQTSEVSKTLSLGNFGSLQKHAIELLLHRGVSFHWLEKSVYDKRRNRGEAEYISTMVRDLLMRREGLSLGIIAFSEAQQDEIEGALNRLAQGDNEFRQLYEEELQREVDGQFVGLLVKNLENIQGDERDVIILSICYGHGPNGKMLMNFGPINQTGGEKRLNVAFSRAKQRMAVVSSIRSTAITNDYNEGANCLKNYLRYAEAVSLGDAEGARRVLTGISRWRDRGDSTDLGGNAVCEQLAAALRERTFEVDVGVGQSHFRVDLAVRRPGEPHYCLGIVVDSLTYYEQAESLEREMMRPRLLRNFGWQITVVLAKDWYEEGPAELARIMKLLEIDGAGR